ncbi:MAG: hypothetical protein CM1200mP9_10710 [Gammaproteobacteria bacterium]|nr:MAG: hypothetical protein CM1200mP9_10710 [Gammaproteobacteria bacterium]
MMRLAFEQCGLSQTEADTKAREAFDVFIQWRNTITFYDGAQDTLNALSQRYQLAALTNGNADIQKLGLGRYFSFAISAAELAPVSRAPRCFSKRYVAPKFHPSKLRMSATTQLTTLKALIA